MTAGETKVVVRKLVCTLHSAGEWFWKPRSPGCTPDLWSQPLWHGAQRAASLWKAPRWFQYMVKGGECQEGGLLAAWVNAEFLRCEYLAWGDIMIWLPVRLMDYGSFSSCNYGVWEQPVSTNPIRMSVHRAPSLKHTEFYLWAVQSSSSYLWTNNWCILWGENRKYSWRESITVLILTVTHSVTAQLWGQATWAQRDFSQSLSLASHTTSWTLFLRKLNLGILWHKC